MCRRREEEKSAGLSGGGGAQVWRIVCPATCMHYYRGLQLCAGEIRTALTRCWSVPGDCHLFMFAIVGEEGRRLFSACLLVDLTGGWENEGVGGGEGGGGGD